MLFESCNEVRGHFSELLDGRFEHEAVRAVRFHLGYCPACRGEFERQQTVQADLCALPRQRVSPELALRLRVRLSQELHRNLMGRLWVRLENAFRPLLLPASGGVFAAICCFALIMGAHVVPAGNPPDVPTGFTTPPRVDVLAPFDFNTGDQAVVVVVTRVNAAGRVMGYRVVSGKESPELTERLDRMMYYSVFHPATMFGRPTDGHVIFSLRHVHITVRG
jgi:putative zinc finger protein